MVLRVFPTTDSLHTRLIGSSFATFDGANSGRNILKCGIPQGSYLGPLLFLLYINDFENCFENMTQNMYADDTCVTVASENLNDLITDLENELEINQTG